MGRPEQPRIVVMGAGFAGLHAVRVLAGDGRRVLWIDAHNYHTFLPLLYQVATAGLEPQAIVYPARAFLRRLPGVEFRMARIAGADPVAGTLLTDAAEPIPYDYLIVATGGATESFGIPGVQEHAFELYDVDGARTLRNHVLEQLERATVEPHAPTRDALLTFVVVGGGPTGVETAGALAEFRRHVVPRDYPSLGPDRVRIVLLEASQRLLAPFDQPLQERARRDLEAFGVEVRLGAAVTRVSPDRVQLKSGDHLPTRTVIWAAGIRAGGVAARLGLATGRSGRIRVLPTLQAVGHPNVYAAGDVALIDGAETLPQVAQFAMQGGAHAAHNVLRAIAGQAPTEFHYDDKGTMATIGRSRAVAQIGRFRLTGALAWWAWLGLHLIMLIGFRNRLVVLVDWAWNYLTYDRGLRAIVGPTTCPAPPDEAAVEQPVTASGHPS